MGIKERRDVEKTEMKRKIMNAAIEIIAQEGYEKLSIRKIAVKIEYSPTTIYLYYKDKAEIIADMSDALYGKVFGDALASINENATLAVEAQAYKIMRIFIKGLCSEPEMAKAIMFSGINFIFASSSTASKPANSGIEMLDKLIAKGVSEKAFRPNAQNTSWIIVSAMLGFVMSSIANQLYLLNNFDQLVDDFVKILMEGIKQ